MEIGRQSNYYYRWVFLGKPPFNLWKSSQKNFAMRQQSHSAKWDAANNKFLAVDARRITATLKKLNSVK
jgi:hypothetical protein